jgi:hypothetical protein
LAIAPSRPRYNISFVVGFPLSNLDATTFVEAAAARASSRRAAGYGSISV